jgi:hypothetical protein
MKRPKLFLIIGLVVGGGLGIGLAWLLQLWQLKDATAELAVVNKHLNAGEM